jgi:hypothetical protein
VVDKPRKAAPVALPGALPNIKMQKTGAKDVLYVNVSARF